MSWSSPCLFSLLHKIAQIKIAHSEQAQYQLQKHYPLAVSSNVSAELSFSCVPSQVLAKQCNQLLLDGSPMLKKRRSCAYTLTLNLQQANTHDDVRTTTASTHKNSSSTMKTNAYNVQQPNQRYPKNLVLRLRSHCQCCTTQENLIHT